MAISKADKALIRAKYGDQIYDAIIAAENVVVTDSGEEKWLSDVLATLALKTSIPTNNNQLTNGAGYQTSSDVASAINAKIASVYKPGGSVAFASLPALSADNEGYIYNITDDFTTTADFLEGEGKKYKAGADVGIVAVKNGDSTEYKYNVFANFVDLTGYVEKVSGATAGNLPKLKADGSIEDSGIDASKVLTEHQDISGKADKVTGATSGDLAGLDANGNPTDSGIKASDVSAHLSDTDKHASADEKSAWNGKATLFVGATQPEGMKNGDIWFQTFTA
jgi:hypothetical protein